MVKSKSEERLGRLDGATECPVNESPGNRVPSHQVPSHQVPRLTKSNPTNFKIFFKTKFHFQALTESDTHINSIGRDTIVDRHNLT